MPSDPQRVQAIFIDAVQKSESERAEFLERECGGDSELRRRVDALISAHDQSGSFLDSPPKDLAGTSPTVAHSMPEQAGSLIGPFKLLQQIGEGGMGSVFMAEQIEPVERRVALKIIKPGMDTKAVIARFEAERQALAMMDHPNIAKVLDVGTTNSGRPYFVMELVRGVPITQYCDEHHLTPRQRLELFLPVCQAVQHAHQKGIIHRDIKPSNVLVAEYDDQPVPKIIDFGLAKAMEKRLTAKTMFTEFGQVVGTPDYMSPEQAKLNQMDIDTRSDIYSLGVLLYELLSGNTPFDRQRLRSAAFDELLRIIREEEPPKPSQRLSTVETLPSIAANRHITPAELTRQLSGELDWIVMKSIEKDRSRRYETANGLAADLRRYLNDDPVLACPPSAAYRLRKFARRNRLAVSTSLLIAASLLVGVLGTVWQSTRAARAEREYLEESTKRTASDATLNKQHAVRVSWIPSIQRLRDADQRFEALKLVQQAKAVLPNDPIVTELFDELSATVSIQTNPSGAEVAIKDWQTVKSDWQIVGQTPIPAAVLPHGPVRFRFSQEGYVAVERLIVVSPATVIHHQLHDEDKLPKGMLFIPGRKALIKKGVDAFFADKYEVTNRQFKRFVDAGGYETGDYWKHEFQKEGLTIPWREAMGKMHDRTGQPGPATWVNGQYPDAEENYPVRGVSWYEAAAYAEFANKSLPTIHHWAEAASLGKAQYIAPLGNFSGSGPVEVGNHSGITGFGLYDMAGNVKEWCWNETESGGRWIRGGSWREPTYMFGVWDAASPFSRAPDFGFRCVRYLKPPSANVLAAAPQTNFAYKPANPATTEELELYRRHYLFEKERPLNAAIVSIDDSNEGYRHKIVEVDTAYANERLPLHMFYPRDAKRPLLPILYYPGAGAKLARSIGESGKFFDLRFVLGLVRGGRVVCWPVYHGTFERKFTEPRSSSIQYRDIEIRRTKDLIRAVDYLETQPDLDTNNLAFVGFSWGGGHGPLVAGVEPRLRLCVFTCGGLFPNGRIFPPEINPYNFAPAVKAPVLMINGRFDQFFPMVQSQIPLFELLGSDEKDHYHFDSGHATPEVPTIQRVNEWLDRHSDATSLDAPAAHAKGAAAENVRGE